MKNVVFIGGGLGNQMFGYSYAMMMRERGFKIICDWGLLKNGNEHNGYELEKVFKNIDAQCTTIMPFLLRVVYTFTYILKVPFLASLLKVIGWEYVIDKENMLNPKSHYNHLLSGNSMSTDLLPQKFNFEFREEKLNNDTKTLAKQISDVNSVSIHIRRGDYLSSHYNWLYKNICTDKYYKKAIDYIKENVERPVFYIFSNDVEWVKNNMSDIDPVIVDCNHGTDSWQDMYLMSKCKHNIVANSTFSWWGAYLNKNQNKVVIRPSKFDNDNRAPEVFPKEWVIVNS